jgi:hypothetical protein
LSPFCFRHDNCCCYFAACLLCIPCSISTHAYVRIFLRT